MKKYIIYSSVALAIFFLGFCFKEPITLFLSSTYLFGIFDALGFYLLLNNVEKDKYQDSLISYRIIQILFQAILILGLVVIEPISSFAFIIAWWFGTCDWLYYKILKQDYTKMGPMYWTWWTAYGIFYGIFGKPINHKVFTAFAYLGIIIPLLIIIYIFYINPDYYTINLINWYDN